MNRGKSHSHPGQMPTCEKVCEVGPAYHARGCSDVQGASVGLGVESAGTWEWRAWGRGGAASAMQEPNSLMPPRALSKAKKCFQSAPMLSFSHSPTPSDAQSLARVDTVFRNFFTDR